MATKIRLKKEVLFATFFTSHPVALQQQQQQQQGLARTTRLSRSSWASSRPLLKSGEISVRFVKIWRTHRPA